MSGALDLRRARITLRERSVVDVLDLALRFVVVHARAYALVALGSLIPLAGVSLLAGYAIGWPLAWSVAIPLAVIAQTPFTVLASSLVFDDRIRVREVLRTALREAPRLLVGRALAVALIAVGILMLILPGLFVAPLFLFTSEVMMLERTPLMKAFGRSHDLASGATFEVVVGTFALALISVTSVLVADIAGRTIIGELLQFRPPRSFWSEGGSTLAVLGLFAQVPFIATARFCVYLNVRTRSEGWDIQTLFAAIAQRAEAAEAAESARAT